jgi:beta-galactosidase
MDMTSDTLVNSRPAQALWQQQFTQIIYGGDYNPEQWPEEIWHEDARLMREAGVNLVSLGVFAWARCEPQPGQYDFAWLDTVIDLLYAHDVRVNLGTGTPAPPPWLAKLHPESLPVTADGVVLVQGSRRHYSPHSSAYRRYAARFVTKLAERYGNHPALAMWHIDNEYSCHIAECFGPESDGAFRSWLRERYGSLEALNTAWSSTFWGQIYGDWEEIGPPRRTPYLHNPAMQLDWKRFSSHALLECFADQRRILKRITPNIPVTTNFMGFNKALDHWAWAAQQDIIANDSYPEPTDPNSPLWFAMECDLMRSLGGGRPWLLMEQVTSHVNWRTRNTPKRPGQMRAGSYQALAHGAAGVMFFQWRASQGGGEQFHGAMLPHVGADSRVFREVRELGHELAALEALHNSRIKAEVAILLDYESWWALELEGKPSADVRLMPAIQTCYAQFYQRNIAVDFAHPSADLSRYRLVIAPHLYLVSEAIVANLISYVQGGGVLLMNFFSGIVDAQSRVWLGGYPALFRQLLGLYVEEFVPYATTEANAVITDDEEEFPCQLWSDVIQLEGATALARYRDDFYADRAALTSHRFGAGTSYYLGTALDSAGMDWLVERILREHKLAALANPLAGESTLRRTGDQAWRFVINHKPAALQIQLAEHERDLLSGQVGGTLVLPQYGVAIIV